MIYIDPSGHVDVPYVPRVPDIPYIPGNDIFSLTNYLSSINSINDITDVTDKLTAPVEAAKNAANLRAMLSGQNIISAAGTISSIADTVTMGTLPVFATQPEITFSPPGLATVGSLAGMKAVAFGLGMIGKGMKAAEDAGKMGGATGEAIGNGIGYKSFDAFKYAQGPAGKDMAWHHVVEQTSGNIDKFGVQSVHNTDNLIKLPNGAGSIHAQISGYYSSKTYFTEGLTVRQWLSTQSYTQQYNFGLQVIEQFGGKEWLK